MLDVTKSYPAKNVVLQDIAEVEYLPLETKEGFLLGENPRWHYMDDDILITNNESEVITFDRRTGKAISSFNRKGRGPGEYNIIGSIAVDRKNNELFITQGSLSGNIHAINAYNMDGKHIWTLEFSNLGFPGYFHVYDDNHLFMRHPDKKEAAPFKLMSKTDTVLTDLPIRFEGRDDMTVSETTENGKRAISVTGTTLAKVTEKDYLIAETGVDTIYAWNTDSGKLTPVMTRIPPFGSMKYPIALFADWQSRDYIRLKTIERKFEFPAGGNFNIGNLNGFASVKLFYDKNDGQFYTGNLVNSDIDDGKGSIVDVSDTRFGIPAGTFIVSLQPYKLKELYEEGRLRGKLAEIAPKLKDEDNPVLLIATFK